MHSCRWSKGQPTDGGLGPAEAVLRIGLGMDLGMVLEMGLGAVTKGETRVYRVELGRALHRVRTWVLASGLAALGILPVVVLATTSATNSDGGPPFFDLIRHSGLIASLAAVALIQPFFLPLGTGLLSGESIASEASGGTLRYLVVRPVGRVRLVLSKYLAVMTQLAAAIVWIAVV